MKIPPEIEASVAEMAEHLGGEDVLGAVIRAHIRIESVLIRIVEQLVRAPSHLKHLNLDYNGYVALAIALGLTPKLGPSLRAMGSLRNNFAHKLRTALDKNTVNALYKALRTEDQLQVQEAYKRIRKESPKVHHIATFGRLPPRDQFQLIAITLWASVQAEELKLRQESSA